MHQKSPSGQPPRHCFVHSAFTLRNSPSEERPNSEPGTPSEHSNCSFNKGKSQGISLVTLGGSVSSGLPSSGFVSTSLAGCTPKFHGTQKIRPLSKTAVREDGELEDILDELVHFVGTGRLRHRKVSCRWTTLYFRRIKQNIALDNHALTEFDFDVDGLRLPDTPVQ